MIEDTIARAPYLTSIIDENTTPQDILKLALGEIDFKILEEKPVEFKCSCSPERAVSIVASLGKIEAASMLAEDKGTAVTCGFCNETYKIDEAQLSEILASPEN